MPAPHPNPMIALEMPLDAFNKVQGILAKRPFEEVADLVLNFRAQVGTQIERITAQQREEAELASRPPPPPPTRLHPVEEAEPAG
jgi:hypothetical protein